MWSLFAEISIKHLEYVFVEDHHDKTVKVSEVWRTSCVDITFEAQESVNVTSKAYFNRKEFPVCHHWKEVDHWHTYPLMS